MARILITGGTGFVGSNLASFYKHRHQVTIASRRPPKEEVSSIIWNPLDVTDSKSTLHTLQRFQPEVVIHCAGIKDVRYCEQNPEVAHKINALGTQAVASACRIIGAKLIYLSTDLVFPCDRGGYRENDIPGSPIVYGRSKHQGELLAMQEIHNLAVCRSAGVYGHLSPLLQWLEKQVRLGQDVECFLDVSNSPTFADNLGEMLQAILDKDLTGIFHTAGCRKVNRYEFFALFAHIFNLDSTLLKPSTLGDRRKQMLLMPDASLNCDYSLDYLGVNSDSPAEGFLKLKASGEFHQPLQRGLAFENENFVRL